MSDIVWLSHQHLDFPPIESALEEPNGLLAAGGDLSVARLTRAYQQGIFPWYEEGQPILWWSPNPRSVVFPEQIKISRSLRKTLKKNHFQVTLDHDFEQVIRACSGPRPDSEGTWITPEMIEAYITLHKAGLAHSVETWLDGQLVGGLYGISLGRMFFGESMFSHVSDASKVAFAQLCRQLQRWQFEVIDCQVSNNHLKSLGSIEIPLNEFKELLNNNVHLPGQFNWKQTLSDWD